MSHEPDSGLSDFYNDKLRSTGSCSKVPLDVQRLECSRSRRSDVVLPALLVAETSLLALFCHQTGHRPRRVSRAPDLRLAVAYTGSGALSTPAGCSHR